MLAIVNPKYGIAVNVWAYIGGFAAGAVFATLFPKQPIVLNRRTVRG
jgi:hypothetical protein